MGWLVPIIHGRVLPHSAHNMFGAYFAGMNCQQQSKPINDKLTLIAIAIGAVVLACGMALALMLKY